MLKVAVLVSGGGTNLQAIIDGIENGSITNAKIDVVISNNKNAYALERAKKHDIEAVALSPKDFETRDLFNEALYNELVDRKIDLIVLAGCLVVIPEKIIHEFENRIINIHPSLIPSFCGTGYYGLKVHEKALARGVKVSGATVHFARAVASARLSSPCSCCRWCAAGNSPNCAAAPRWRPCSAWPRPG